MKISKGGGLPQEHENIEVHEIPFKKAMELMEMGKIKDAKTIMLLQYAELKSLI